MNTAATRGWQGAILALLVAVTFCLPIFWQEVGIRPFRFLVLYAAAMSAFMVWLCGRDWALGAFGAWCALSIVFVSGGSASMRALLYVVAGLGLWRMAREYLNRGVFLDALVAMALVQTAYQAVQFVGLDPIMTTTAGHSPLEIYVGFTGNKDLIGILQAMAIPASLERRRWAVVPLLGGMAMSGVVTAWASVVAFLLVAFYINERRKRGWQYATAWAALGAVMVAAMLSDPRVLHAFDDRRWEVWGQIADRASWFGHGLGSFHGAPIVVGGMHFHEAHNEYAQVLHELGVPGLLAILAAAGAYAFRLVRSNDGTLLAIGVVLAVCSAGLFPFHAPDAAAWSVAYLGVASRA